MRITGGTGIDFGIECAGSPDGLQTLIRAAAPAGRIVLIGMGPQPVEVDTVAATVNEVDISTVFRYANVHPTTIDLVASGRIDVSPLITDRFSLDRAVEAFEFARTRALLRPSRLRWSLRWRPRQRPALFDGQFSHCLRQLRRGVQSRRRRVRPHR